MFTEQMIAPCGLNCSLCKEALKAENPCQGCNGDSSVKPEYCSLRCKIIICSMRESLAGEFCDKCPSYPCEHILEREHRYAAAYAMVESPIQNLKRIREEGMEQFLSSEREAWSCTACGGIICVHTGVCSQCGRQYSAQNQI